MTASQIGNICTICSLEFASGDKVEVFACHRTHMLHEDCFKELEKFATKKKSKLTCPVCRKLVDKEKIEKK